MQLTLILFPQSHLEVRTAAFNGVVASILVDDTEDELGMDNVEVRDDDNDDDDVVVVVVDDDDDDDDKEEETEADISVFCSSSLKANDKSPD